MYKNNQLHRENVLNVSKPKTYRDLLMSATADVMVAASNPENRSRLETFFPPIYS